MPSGGGSGTTSTVTQQELSPQQQKLINLALPAATEFAKNPPTLFPGSQVVGFNPLEVASQDAVLAAAQGPVGQLTNNALAGSNFMLSGNVLDPRTNHGLQGAITAATRPIFQGLTESALPSIRGEFSGLGQYGSTRQGIAEGIATRGAMDAASDAASNISFQGYNSGLDAFSRALALAPGTQTMGYQPALAMGDVGSIRRGMEQSLLDEEASRYMSEQLLPFLAAQEVAGLAMGMPGGSVLSQSTTPVSRMNPALGAGGGALSGAAMGSMILPGWGTAVGAGIGGLMGLFGSR